MKARWLTAPPDAALSAALARQFGFSPLLGQCLINRGYKTPEAVAAFIQPRLKNLSDPFLLPNMEAAIKRLFSALSSDEPFVIFGDYDVDGATATALLHEFFARAGFRSHYYLPNRFGEGYGLSPEAVETCLQRFGCKLILAVDCGSTSESLIAELGQRGVDVIVLDHHELSVPPPPAIALVNPQLLQDSPLRDLCSVGLAFKLAHACLKTGRDLELDWARKIDLREFLDLAALGTIADIVPLRGENRILVSKGLEQMRSAPRLGVAALERAAGLREPLSAHHLAFQLGPRLNAAGRLESALASLQLLLSTDPSEADRLASELDGQNRQRQKIEQQILDEVLTLIHAKFDPERDFAIVEGDESWHIGVIGIVASRVMREFHRPAIIIGSDGTGGWRGSGRSIAGFDIAHGLRSCADLLLKHGGHKAAVGLSIHPENLASFRTRFNEFARGLLSPELLAPSLQFDAEAPLNEITPGLLRELQKLEPTGHHNSRVQFFARNLQIKGAPRRFGSADRHMKFWVTNGDVTLQAIWWRCPQDQKFAKSVDIAFQPELDVENGRTVLNLKVIACRESIQ